VTRPALLATSPADELAAIQGDLYAIARDLAAIVAKADPASEVFARASIAAHWVRIGALHAGGREKKGATR
jgi:hypothetical protein